MRIVLLVYSASLELLSEHDVAEGLGEDLGIKPPGTVLQIVEVELQSSQHLLHGVGVAVVERGVGGHARSNLVEERIAFVVLHDLVDVELALRAGTDERHVADEHIPELGQFVEVVVTEEHADLGHAGVLLMGEELRPVLLGIHSHGAELIDVERPSEPSDSLLLEDGGSPVLPFHQVVADGEER